MTKYVAAIDQGTTSIRCMIFDHAGKVISLAQKEHEQIYPRPGWVEHNPAVIMYGQFMNCPYAINEINAATPNPVMITPEVR